MILSKSFSAQTQTHFQYPTNLHKTSFIQSSPHVSLNFRNTHLKNPVISIRRSRYSPPIVAATNQSYTPSPEENLYDLLAIPETGTLSEIKRAYKKMALKYHPDVSPPDRADENTMRFIRVQEAYRTLSDPDTRAKYDISRIKGLNSAFSGKKRSRFEARSDKKTSWQVQVAELKRRKTVDMVSVDRRGRMSWASRIRKQRKEAWAHEPVSGQ